MGDLLLAAVGGLLVAVLCTPVGVSGAVLLLPAQTGLLGLAGPQVSSTNLLFNVISTPGGLSRLRRSTLLARTDWSRCSSWRCRPPWSGRCCG